ncbi:MAG: hypothetical protein EOP48_26860 [Sphingobacteriales bacterium]|nr:MAG: hypothetical protein EOP48_26860 [Sphingobacteriales bacterium]
MVTELRKKFNDAFSDTKYQEFLKELQDGYNDIPFRVAETPVFLTDEIREQLIQAGDDIIALIKQQGFKTLTNRSIPAQWNVPNENRHPHFLTFDFGICRESEGKIKPMLIEMQGFPSLYGFQAHLAQSYKGSFGLDPSLTPFFNGLQHDEYIALLKKVLIGQHDPSEVALMDVDAAHQKTAIDFFVTREFTGIQVLSLDEIHQEGKRLFYEKDGRKVYLKRIYNRLIFDEIEANKDAFANSFDPRQELDIEWVTHPNWFYRVSKFTMPFLKNEFVPETFFLNEVNDIPSDLENYVLKPLFSFAGQGVIIDVEPSDITSIEDKENWILQRKVNYEPVVKSPDGGVKVEIRLMYLWPDNEEPQLCINLARLSRGKMIGVRYNKDFDWVGGTVGLMHKH